MTKKEQKVLAKNIVAVASEVGSSEKDIVLEYVNKAIDKNDLTNKTVREIQFILGDAIIEAEVGLGSSSVDLITYNIATRISDK